MAQQTDNRVYCVNSDSSGGSKVVTKDSQRVTRKERENEVVQLLAEFKVPLPPKAIYRALKVKKGITFSYSTVGNILRRLRKDGEVMRCDKDALDQGEIKALPDAEKDRRTYYYLTNRGFDRAEELTE